MNTRNPAHYYDSRGSTVYWKRSFHTRVLAVGGRSARFMEREISHCVSPLPVSGSARSQSRFATLRPRDASSCSLNPRFHFRTWFVAKLTLENYTDLLITQTFGVFRSFNSTDFACIYSSSHLLPRFILFFFSKCQRFISI